MIKSGVDAGGLRPEVLLAIQEARELWSIKGQQLVITSLRDGKHSPKSLHYRGLAVDFRLPVRNGIYNEAAEREDNYDFVTALRGRLGQQYDVVMEPDHIHVEFDPRYD